MINFSEDIEGWVGQKGYPQFGWLSSTKNQNSDSDNESRLEAEESESSGQPGEQFRNDLHRALESTHRQHAAQRTLGIRQPYTEPSVWHNSLIKLPALLLITAAIFYIWQYHNGNITMANKK